MTDPLVHELTPAPDPVAACQALAGLPYRLFLDSATSDTRLGSYSFVTADPVAVMRSTGTSVEWLSLLTDGPVASNPSGPWGAASFETAMPDPATTRRDSSRGDALRMLRDRLAAFATRPIDGLPPFQGGAAGYCAYEFGRALEPIPRARYDDLALPDAVLGVYDWVLAWDHRAGRAWVISTGLPEPTADTRRTRARTRLQGVLACLRGTDPHPTPPPPPNRPATTSRVESYVVDAPWLDGCAGVRSSFTREGYIAAVDRVRDLIVAGDVFQANISQRFEIPLTEDPWTLYQRLRRRNAAPFAAFLDFPDTAILSASPERFLRVDPTGLVETRPIKGTRPRGLGPEHDAHLGRELVESEKDQAENLMIVDLMRNDLSRVCQPGTVRTSELFALEHYATVHHLVSTIVGRLAPGLDALDALAAAFPGGSVTGAPKIRAMEIIADIEPSARGVYCGAIGYTSLTGALDTSIAIRTAVARDGRVTFSAGGGVTFASDPRQEYRETLDKARGMIDALVSPDGPRRRQP